MGIRSLKGGIMYPKISVNLGNLVLSLSDALDLAFSSLAMHQQRTAFIAWELGKRAKLEEKRIENVFIAGLLHDIGALSIEEKKSLHDNETTEVEQHCIRGQNLFKSTPWLAPCADLVRYHHRDWVMWEGLQNAPEAFDSQLLFLADYLERQVDRKTYILHQNEALCSRMKELAGKQINSEIIDLFLELSHREEFWLDLTSPRLYSLLLNNGPFQTIEVDINSIVIFAKLLGMIVDFKSTFTATHSSGVAQCSMLLAGMVGMSESEVKLMEVAGLLHDLGKLVVPNAILEKPAGLTHAEMAVMKQHTYYTFSILSTIGGLQMIAEWAAYHHERLDGKGYPFKREAHEINLGARIMAVSDIFTALAEDRPYRKGMEAERIMAILQEQASHGIQDPRIVKLLLENMEEVRKATTERQEQARHYYQTEVAKSE
jgi:HD-GYP domain-containing protein (c-di-GMP phosphodiesterase class II)